MAVLRTLIFDIAQINPSIPHRFASTVSDGFVCDCLSPPNGDRYAALQPHDRLPILTPDRRLEHLAI
ncbi:hypothetical protein BDI4_190067 [Burkholderia diffusa]|nr:hypothetical protein BDI4_190067 [Burkholderia diffusa]